jgi:hypothetical protein
VTYCLKLVKAGHKRRKSRKPQNSIKRKIIMTTDAWTTVDLMTVDTCGRLHSWSPSCIEQLIVYENTVTTWPRCHSQNIVQISASLTSISRLDVIYCRSVHAQCSSTTTSENDSVRSVSIMEWLDISVVTNVITSSVPSFWSRKSDERMDRVATLQVTV